MQNTECTCKTSSFPHDMFLPCQGSNDIGMTQGPENILSTESVWRENHKKNMQDFRMILLLVQKSRRQQPPFGLVLIYLVNEWDFNYLSLNWFSNAGFLNHQWVNSTIQAPSAIPSSPISADESVEFFSQLRQVLAILFIALGYLHRQVPLEKTSSGLNSQQSRGDPTIDHPWSNWW